jgi:hypothetical protein
MLGRDEMLGTFVRETFLAAFRNLRKFRGTPNSRRGCIGSHSTPAIPTSGNRRLQPEQSLDQEDESGRRFEPADAVQRILGTRSSTSSVLPLFAGPSVLTGRDEAGYVMKEYEV